MKVANEKPIGRKENLVTQELNGETLVYDLSENKAFCLNETSAFVWRMCDGERTAAEIALELGERNKTPVSEDFVWYSLSQLNSVNLLEKDSFADRFAGVSRREAVRKIGFASMVALPLISAVVAPVASQAASGVFCGCVRPGFGPNTNAWDAGCPCVTPADCCGTCSASFFANLSLALLVAFSRLLVAINEVSANFE